MNSPGKTNFAKVQLVQKNSGKFGRSLLPEEYRTLEKVMQVKRHKLKPLCDLVATLRADSILKRNTGADK